MHLLHMYLPLHGCMHIFLLRKPRKQCIIKMVGFTLNLEWHIFENKFQTLEWHTFQDGGSTIKVKQFSSKGDPLPLAVTRLISQGHRRAEDAEPLDQRPTRRRHTVQLKIRGMLIQKTKTYFTIYSVNTLINKVETYSTIFGSPQSIKRLLRYKSTGAVEIGNP